MAGPSGSRGLEALSWRRLEIADGKNNMSFEKAEMKRIISLALTVVATVVTLAACGGATGAPKATTSTAVSTTRPSVPTTIASSAVTRREAATFLRVASPYDAVVKQVNASKLDSPTTAGLQAALAPLVRASNTFTSGILSASFTGQAAGAARTMAIAVEAVVADIQSVTKANWTSERYVIAHAEETVGDENKVVRADLGLSVEAAVSG
jgi:hypothetical protein